MSARVDVPLPPTTPPKPAVALRGAEVVEFFGVPLDDAHDVIFVLDVSGSMNGAATGVIASLPGHPKDAAVAASTVVTDPNAQPIQPDPNAPQATPAATPAASPATTPASPAMPVTPTKMEVARAELLAALERLPDETRANVIFFADGLIAFAARSVPVGQQRSRLLEFVASSDAHGSTALAPALRAAFLQNVPRVILLSDGQGNVGGDDYDVLRDAREAMHGGVRIDAIGIGDHDRELMSALATESGGLYQSL